MLQLLDQLNSKPTNLVNPKNYYLSFLRLIKFVLPDRRGVAVGVAETIYLVYRTIYFVQFNVSNSFHLLSYNLVIAQFYWVFSNDRSSALGALGRKFESRLPDWLFSEGQNPSWEKIGKNK